jgi:hypothetical protein
LYILLARNAKSRLIIKLQEISTAISTQAAKQNPDFISSNISMIKPLVLLLKQFLIVTIEFCS